MRKSIALIFFCLGCVFLLASCNKEKTRDGYLVTFHLEGATYQQGDEIRYYYPENQEGTLIFEPNDLITSETDKIRKEGYYIEGWYTSPKFNADEKWDFAKDKLTASGLNLYANWKFAAVYKFALISEIDNSILGEYTVEEGETFSDYFDYVETVDGYTFIEFKDENGNIIEDNTYSHPGGDTDTTINIYASFIEGDFQIVKDVSDLQEAILRKRNIYLYNDIDCEEEIIDFADFSARTFLGNGYTISNFSYNDNLANHENGIMNISLFDSISNSTITDVSFTLGQIAYSRFSQVREINVLPLAVNIDNSNLTNISISYQLSIADAEAEAKTTEYNDPALEINNSTITNVQIQKEIDGGK